MRRILLSVVILAIPGVYAGARDGLYAPSRPEDAALVRVVNLSPDLESPEIDIGPIHFESRSPLSAGPYRPVPLGVYVLADGRQTVFTPEPESFVTVITGYDPSSPRTMRLFSDQPHDDPARAQLVFYNLAGRPLSIVAAGSETVVFKPLEPLRSDAVAVNAIAVELEVRDGSIPVGRTAVTLTRGSSISFFAFVDNGTIRVFSAEAVVRTD